MITLLGRRSSINVQKVLWTLLEIGVPHEHEELGGRFGGLQTERFLTLNPNGRIPVLIDGKTVVWESQAIVRYLCARYAGNRYWPEDPAARARSDEWMEWCTTTLQPAFMGFFWGWYRTPETERNARQNATQLALAHAAFDLADRHLAATERDKLSMAGLVIGAQLYRYFTLGIERPELRVLEEWYRSLCERPAYREGVMQPYDQLKGRLAF
jgi:glutathione S-transferase